MEKYIITPNLYINDVLNTWPETIPVFFNFKMNCVGCDMNLFETIQDALQIYNLSAEIFLHEINAVVVNANNS